MLERAISHARSYLYSYVENVAENILFASERYNQSDPVNPSTEFTVSSGSAFEISIKNVIEFHHPADRF